MVSKSVPLSEILTLAIDAVEVEPTALYNMAGVYGFGRGLFERGPLSGAETTYKYFHRLSKGMVVLSQLKGWEGAIAVVGDQHSGCFLSTQFPTFRHNAKVANIRYISWFLRQAAVWEKLRYSARGMGARRDTISPTKFLELKIPLPALDEQEAIAKQLDDVEAQLNDRLAALQSIEQDTSAMLQNAFDKIVDGANYRPLGEVAPLVRREIKIEPNESYTEIGIRSFYNGIFHRRTMAGSEFSWQKLFRISANDLVFSNLMAWEQAIAVSQHHDEGCVGNHRMLTCEVNTEVANPVFLMFYFKTIEGFAKVVGNSPGSIARNKTLSSKQLPKIEVPIPHIEDQRRFDKLYAGVEEIRTIRGLTAMEAKALLPAMLHEIFEKRPNAVNKPLVPTSTVVAFQARPQPATVDTPFNEGVLVGAIINAFHEEGGQPLGNFRLQKAVYFARRFMGETALEGEYLRKAAGPYNPTMRYSGGMKVALDKNWIAPETGKYGPGHSPGSGISEAESWIEKCSFAQAAAWVRDKFKFKQNDLWELLATIDYAMLALTHQGAIATAHAVLDYIDQDPEWHPKIAKLGLTEPAIQNAMVELTSLFDAVQGDREVST